jgi:hypothetical protein
MNTENATPVQEQVVKVYTSEKLTELKGKRAELMAAIRTEQDDDKAFELNQELFGIGQQMKAEVARLKAEEAKAENEAKRAAKIAELSKLVNLGIVNDKVAADKKATEEDKAAAKLAYDTQFDIIANQILGSLPKAPSAPKAEGGPAKSGTSAEIVEKHQANLAAGMNATDSKKALVEQGFSRGTVGAAVLAWEKANGIK